MTPFDLITYALVGGGLTATTVSGLTYVTASRRAARELKQEARDAMMAHDRHGEPIKTAAEKELEADLATDWGEVSFYQMEHELCAETGEWLPGHRESCPTCLKEEAEAERERLREERRAAARSNAEMVETHTPYPGASWDSEEIHEWTATGQVLVSYRATTHDADKCMTCDFEAAPEEVRESVRKIMSRGSVALAAEALRQWRVSENLKGTPGAKFKALVESGPTRRHNAHGGHRPGCACGPCTGGTGYVNNGKRAHEPWCECGSCRARRKGGKGEFVMAPDLKQLAAETWRKPRPGTTRDW